MLRLSHATTHYFKDTQKRYDLKKLGDLIPLKPDMHPLSGNTYLYILISRGAFSFQKFDYVGDIVPIKMGCPKGILTA